MVAVAVGVGVGVAVAVGDGGVVGVAVVVDSAREVNVKERPILFSAPMVRAIIAGRKAQTRRAVKPPAWVTDADMLSLATLPSARGLTELVDGRPRRVFRCPYGTPGDRLWVKETWRPERDNQCERITYAADGAVAHEGEAPGSWRRPEVAGNGWVSPLFMPHWASRLVLEVTAVRVERLNDISDADARAEGIERAADGYWHNYASDGPTHQRAIASYRSLWESINGAGSWGANPWVWVVEFKQVSTSSEVRTA